MRKKRRAPKKRDQKAMQETDYIYKGHAVVLSGQSGRGNSLYMSNGVHLRWAADSRYAVTLDGVAGYWAVVRTPAPCEDCGKKQGSFGLLTMVGTAKRWCGDCKDNHAGATASRAIYAWRKAQAGGAAAGD